MHPFLGAKARPLAAPAHVICRGGVTMALAACRSARARLLELEMTTVEAAVPAATMRRSSGTSGRPCHTPQTLRTMWSRLQVELLC